MTYMKQEHWSTPLNLCREHDSTITNLDNKRSIRRPLPELERASLQLQPSNAILQTAAPPSCRLHHTVRQAAGYSLPCTILKGCL